MRYIAIITVLLVALRTLSGCGPKPESPPDYKVKHLFTQDGVRVYSFYDMGEYRYFASAPGSSVSWMDWRDEGRSVFHRVETAEGTFVFPEKPILVPPGGSVEIPLR